VAQSDCNVCDRIAAATGNTGERRSPSNWAVEFGRAGLLNVAVHWISSAKGGRPRTAFSHRYLQQRRDTPPGSWATTSPYALFRGGFAVGIDDKVATGRGRRFVIAGRLRTLILVGALFQSGHRRRVRLSPWTPVTRRPATGAEASSVEGVRVSEPISAARGGGCVGLRRHL